MDKFIFPIDFVVLGMEENCEIPLILGRPFLATGRTLSNVRSGNLTLRVNDEEVKFNIYHSMKFQDEAHSYNCVEVISDCMKGVIQGVLCSDPLEHCLVHSSFWKEILPTGEVGNAYY